LIDHLSFGSRAFKDVSLEEIKLFDVMGRDRSRKELKPYISGEYEIIVGDIKNLEAIDKEPNGYQIGKSTKFLVYDRGNMDDLGAMFQWLENIEPFINYQDEPHEAYDHTNDLEGYGYLLNRRFILIRAFCLTHGISP
jgi:hypothetical protein